MCASSPLQALPLRDSFDMFCSREDDDRMRGALLHVHIQKLPLHTAITHDHVSKAQDSLSSSGHGVHVSYSTFLASFNHDIVLEGNTASGC